ncbi:MAG: hypothetical protein ACP5IZ_07425, partial [Thermoprotei archaeon]
LLITYNLGNTPILNKTSIYAENFTTVGKWEIFTLTVSLDKKENNLKLLSYVEDKPDVSLQRIEIDQAISNNSNTIIFTPENMLYAENFTSVKLPIKPGESFIIKAVLPYYAASFTVGLWYRCNILLTFYDNSTLRLTSLVYARSD